MKCSSFMSLLILGSICNADGFDRRPLSYAPKPDGTYKPPKASGVITLSDFVNSRSDLTELAKVLSQSAGFIEAFDTTPTWDFTFFAPSNEAFSKHTGQYFNTFTPTPKGKWWLGNLVQHHYVPNTRLNTTVFNETATRIQTGSYLYVGTRVKDGKLWLNDVTTITEGNLEVTKACCHYATYIYHCGFADVYKGVVHIIDRILDPSAQLFEADKPKAGQRFIAGSCSDTSLPYC